MSKFVIGDESSIVIATNEGESCLECIYHNEEDSICSRWRKQTDDEEVCPNFEEVIN